MRKSNASRAASPTAYDKRRERNFTQKHRLRSGFPRPEGPAYVSHGLSPWNNNCTLSRPEGPAYNSHWHSLLNGENSKKSPPKTKNIYELLSVRD